MSAPSPEFGAPSLGPADRIPNPPQPDHGLAWDDITPAAWRAFGEPAPASTKESPPVSYDPKYAGNYNPRPEPQPTPPAPPAPTPSGPQK